MDEHLHSKTYSLVWYYEQTAAQCFIQGYLDATICWTNHIILLSILQLKSQIIPHLLVIVFEVHLMCLVHCKPLQPYYLFIKDSQHQTYFCFFMLELSATYSYLNLCKVLLFVVLETHIFSVQWVIFLKRASERREKYQVLWPFCHYNYH